MYPIDVMDEMAKQQMIKYRSKIKPKVRLLQRLLSLDITDENENTLILETFDKLTPQQQEEYIELDIHQLLFVAYSGKYSR